MVKDILRHLRTTNPDMKFTPIVYNEAIVSIKDICLAIANKRLVQLRMCAPNLFTNVDYDRDLQRITDFDVDDLSIFVEISLSKLV